MNIPVVSFHEFIRFISLHSAIVGLLLSIGIFLADRKTSKNQVLSGIFFSLSGINIHFFVFETGYLNEYPMFSITSIIGMILVGPFLYFLAHLCVDENFRLTKKSVVHLVPAPVFIIILLTLHSIFTFPETNILRGFYPTLFLAVLGSLGWVSFVVYLIKSAHIFITHFVWTKENFKNPISWVTFVVFDTFLAALVTDVLAALYNQKVYLQWSVIFISGCIIDLFMIYLLFPGFNIKIQDQVKKEKYKRTYLSNVDTNAVLSKLQTLMEQNEAFADETLTLNMLAGKLGITSHQLSQLLNEKMQKNFSSYINEYRIKKAVQLLKTNQNYSILGIAYEVGFNSKSAFNTAFRNYTGKTPSTFLHI